ncbi:ribonuclease J [Rhabdaerophilum calidifontis]|uniref:ribonuclease J n=1 Tax=Rhabdaerophilum calidifontis TaxID=2604328 RepID=UPI001238AAEC|nr:ribonuclease J [Rhabdaerophilum calidifontis]
MRNSDLVFVPLGGLGEIGMNMALYGHGRGRARKWLMVDCGVAFAGEDLPGIDLLMPDIRFIEAEKANLLGIVITHAHEDHFGALADLWPRLGAPVYMTPFAANLLEARRLSEPGAPRIPVRQIAQASRFTLGPFDVETIPVAHSIPESMALAIRTKAGTVIHTGDWKIDETPVLGLPTDGNRLREIGDEGVLALVCDSTNVVRDGISPSETEVRENLRAIIAEAKGRVAVTTFASNVARIRAVAEAAAAVGREVILVGRAMDRVVDVAGEGGMLEGIAPFRSPERFKSLARDRCVVLLTGSQGENRAALARVAAGDHPDIALAPGDMVIFSSRTIPGNERAVGAIVNNLVRMGVRIVTDRERLVHVSGHPRRDELQRMYEWVRPRIAIPAHGEALHLTLHRDFARARGVEQVIRAFNGEAVSLAPGPAAIVEQVPAGRLVKDGTLLIPAGDQAIVERKRLAFAGIVVIALAIDDRGQLADDPQIELAGLPAADDEGEAMLDHVRDLVDEVLATLPKAKRRDPDALRLAVERGVRAGIAEIWDKKPVTKVLVLEV